MRQQDGTCHRFDEYVLDFALENVRAGLRIALVTIVRIEGSSPRPLGAQMAVAETGDWVGYLSGGCIERAVVAEALIAIQTKENRRVRYGKGSKYIDIQLPCGSAIELVFDVHVTEHQLSEVDTLLKRRQSGQLEIPGVDESPHAPAFRIYHPRRRLIVAGVGPAAVQLVRLGDISGFETILVSPDDETRNLVKPYASECLNQNDRSVFKPLQAVG